MNRLADEQIIIVIGEIGIGEHGIGEHGIGEYGIGEMLRHRAIIAVVEPPYPGQQWMRLTSYPTHNG